MKFIDYYAVLEISKSSSPKELQKAFWRQAKKFHPDLNKDIDVTDKMQLLNEAYLILKDPQARQRYDIEYDKFFSFKEYESTITSEYEDYSFSDKSLETWMSNAKKQSVELAKQTFKEIMRLSVQAAKAAGKETGRLTVYYLVIGFIMILIALLVGNNTNVFGELINYAMRTVLGISIILFFIWLATTGSKK